MNILDENIPESQRILLRRRRVIVVQIGETVGRKGLKDAEIIRLLHQLDRPTFFSLDRDFYARRLCHPGYCLVQIDAQEEMVADYVRRLLRHRELNSKAKRMGCVIRVLSTGMTFWRIHQECEGQLAWR